MKSVFRTTCRRLLGPEGSRRFRWAEAVYLRTVTRRVGSMSFSQFGEDRVLRVLFPESAGTYVDVGAGEPASGSNTYAFYRAGWSGVLIDAVSRYQRWSRVLRPRDDFRLGLCSSASGQTEFFEFKQAQFSTTDEARATQLIDSGRILAASYPVTSLAIRDLPLTCQPADPCFFSIDVEGAEMSVLDSVDWERTRPAAICIEELEFSLGEPSLVGRYLGDRGYRLEARVGLSSIYLHADSGRNIKLR